MSSALTVSMEAVCLGDIRPLLLFILLRLGVGWEGLSQDLMEAAVAS